MTHATNLHLKLEKSLPYINACEHEKNANWVALLESAVTFSDLNPARPLGDYLKGKAYQGLCLYRKAESSYLNGIYKIDKFSLPIVHACTAPEDEEDYLTNLDIDNETVDVAKKIAQALEEMYQGSGEKTKVRDIYANLHISLMSTFYGPQFELTYSEYLERQGWYGRAIEMVEAYLSNGTCGSNLSPELKERLTKLYRIRLEQLERPLQANDINDFE